MSNYQLISFDMDGTLLNSKKEITPAVLNAMQEAVQKGKQICLSTGRSVAELVEFWDKIPGLRYINCCSGAMVYDHQEDQILFSKTLSIEHVLALLEIASKEDCAVQFIFKECILEQKLSDHLAHYHMAQYKEHFARSAKTVANLKETYAKNPYPIQKLNIYHASKEGLERTEERFKKSQLPLVLVHSEETGLEFSPANVDKGLGLRKLSEFVQIPLEQIIAVGDAENDLAALTIAGLGIAMGNANDVAKAKSDVVVTDCDHDGAAEAIYQYLL